MSVKNGEEATLTIVENCDNANMKTYTIKGEDHTFGNVLTYILDRLEATEFCAYTIGHPQDDAIHIRLKVKSGYSVDQVFESGLVELKAALGIVKSKFKHAVKENNKK